MSGEPNIYEDDAPFGVIAIQGVEVATHLVEVDGCANAEEWTAQKGTGTSGASNVWKGMKLAESIKLKFRSTDAAGFQAQTDLLALVRPKRGDKPPTLRVENAIINWGGITRIVLKQPAFPKWDKATGATDWEWEFSEDSPSQPADTGKADPAKPGDKFTPAPHGDASDNEINKLLDEAKKQ
jgi:hypothetical protein